MSGPPNSAYVCDKIIDFFTVTSWSGYDCSKATYKWTNAAKAILSISLFGLLTIFGILAFFVKKCLEKKVNPPEASENDVKLIKVTKTDDQPNKESETLLAET